MNDQPPGPGWWRANDGNWYPPETHPDAPKPNLPAVQPAPPAAQGQYIPPGSGPQGGQPGFGQQPPGVYGPQTGGPFGGGPGGPTFPPQMPYGGSMPYGGPMPYALSAPRRRRSGGIIPAIVAVVFIGIAASIGVGLIGRAGETDVTSGVGSTTTPAASRTGSFEIASVAFEYPYQSRSEFQLDIPGPALKAVAFELAVTNVSGNPAYFSPKSLMQLSTTDGDSQGPTQLWESMAKLPSIDREIGPGETARGWVFFMIPAEAEPRSLSIQDVGGPALVYPF